MSASEHKRSTRDGARSARRRLSDEDRAAASAAITERALALPEIASATSVLAYSAMEEEADPAALVAALRARGARVALPRVCGPGVLALHWVEEGDPTTPGSFGIREPHESSEWASPADFDLVLVPGVAFDTDCGRLGFGGGFYDALLAVLDPGVPTIGLAFDEQMVDVVPRESHDVHVGVVVTPSAVHRRAG